MTTRFRLLIGGCVLCVAVAVGLFWTRRTETFVRSYDHVLGTSMELKMLASSADAADRAERAVLASVDHDARILSGYDATSEFSRWMATSGDPVSVSPELFDVLQRFDVWRGRTGGALDASAEAVSRVWRVAATQGHIPSSDHIARAVADVRQAHWHLDPVARTATHLSAAPLMLNSFTKSYIVDRAAAAGLAEAGVRAIVVNIGGDIVVRGAWTETVNVTNPHASADNEPPLAQVAVQDRAVATSGVYRRGFDIDGVHYSHIVDPRTGRPTGHVLGATVVARDAADAGALATAMCVLTPEESERLADLVPTAEYLLVLADGREIESAGWRAMMPQAARPSLAPQPVATLHAAEQERWNAGFELTVSFDVAAQAFRARRPYLAVWVEDGDRSPVKTLAVWYSARHSRWLPDLRAWYRSDRLRTMAGGTDILGSVSSATRGPGHYTLTWDGKDNAGQFVKPGPYTVNLEVAREHGTYQLMRQEIDLSGVAHRIELKGNVEVAAASLDYHRVSSK
jgi:FAD:protein FMN transferase